jgi:hypothetical protein
VKGLRTALPSVGNTAFIGHGKRWFMAVNVALLSVVGNVCTMYLQEQEERSFARGNAVLVCGDRRDESPTNLENLFRLTPLLRLPAIV